MNENYEMKLAELREAVKSIPVRVLDRLKSELITNPNGEPVLIFEVVLNKVKPDHLHSVVAYDHQRGYWLSVHDTPDQFDAGRYTFFAPDEWELRTFLLTRLDTMAAALNKSGITPKNTIKTAIMVGDWDGAEQPKEDNLIQVVKLFDMYFAELTLQFEQTADASKAVFYFDWSDHKYYPVENGKDVSDPMQYTMFSYVESCKFKPKTDLSKEFYTLNCMGELIPKLTIKQHCTPPMTAKEFDAEFPGYRELLDHKEDAAYE